MSKPTILVVDDEVFFRRLFADTLAEEGLYEIETATSGDQALARLAEGGVDVVLTDMVMPGTCGLELIRKTRALESPPEIILATGNATVESAIQALKSGARDYLLKPCNPEQLRHVVRSCIEQKRLLDENITLKTQIRLYQKGQQLAAQLDVKTLFHEALTSLLSELGTGRALAFMANTEGVSHTTSSHGITDEQAIVFAESLSNLVQTAADPVLYEAADLDLPDDVPEDLRQIWLYPMHTLDDFHGAIVLCNELGSDLGDALPKESLHFLAEQASLGFVNCCQYQGARDLIYTDDLTGLYNHRYLHIALEQEIRRAERYGLEFSLAFIDLDYFKNINDTHGHLIGSGVLRQIGKLLGTCVRDADMLFRYGGDEFTALLVETDSRGAIVVAERIRAAIEEFAFEDSDSNVMKITATVGHATYPIHATDKNELIDLADKAMYRGKVDRNVTRSATEVNQP